MGSGEVYTGFWCGNLRERVNLKDTRRWEDNIKMDLQEFGCGGLDWIELAQYRDRWMALVNAVMNLRVPENARNFLTGCKPVRFSGRSMLYGVIE
jgi:hypothetical protein